MKKLDKKSISVLVAFAIILAIYIVLVTVIPFEKPAGSWVAFSFGIVSILGSCGITLLAMLKGNGFRSKVYGLPVMKIGFTYLAAQMVVTFVLLVIGAFVAVPGWIATVLGILLLGLCLIGVLVTDNVRDVVEEIEAKAEASIKVMKSFSVDMRTVVSHCKNDKILPLLEALAEDFRYSDPVSNDDTQPIETKIKAEVDNLDALVVADSEHTGEKIDEIKSLLATRNDICKSTKK